MQYINRCLGSSFLLLFALIAVHACWSNIAACIDVQDQASIFWPWLTGILFLSLIFVSSVFRAENAGSIHVRALGFILVTILLRLAWIWYFDSQQVNDFLDYWHCGQVLANAESSPRCTGVYFSRSFVYTLPVHLFLTGSQAALELVNVFFVSAAAVFFYDFARRIFSPAIAAMALLFFTWNPDLWYGITLANPDIPFAFYFSLLTWVLVQLDLFLHSRSSGFVPVFVWALCAGMLIFFVDIQRDYGLPIWIALAVLCLYLTAKFRNRQLCLQAFAGPRARTGRLKYVLLISVFFVLIPYCVYSGAHTLFTRSTHVSHQDQTLAYITSMDVFGSGYYQERRPWQEDYFPRLPEKLQEDFALKKFVQEFITDPDQTLNHFTRKNSVLASPYGTLWLSSRPAEDQSVGRINTKNYNMQMAVNNILAAVVFGLVALRIVLLPAWGLPRESMFLVLFTAFFYLLILFLAEAQERYPLFTIFLTSLLASEILFGLYRWVTKARDRKSWIPKLQRIFSHLILGTAGLTLMAIGFVVAAKSLADSRASLTDMRGFQTLGSSQLPPSTQPSSARKLLSIPARQVKLCDVRVFSGNLQDTHRQVAVRKEKQDRGAIRFWMDKSDPTQGDYAAASLRLENLTPGRGCLLELVLTNPYHGQYTNKLEYRIELDGVIAARQDVAATGQPVRYLVHWTPELSTAELVVRVVAQTDTKPWSWGRAGQINLHYLALRQTVPVSEIRVSATSPVSFIRQNTFKRLTLDISIQDLLAGQGRVAFGTFGQSLADAPVHGMMFFLSVQGRKAPPVQGAPVNLHVFLDQDRVYSIPLQDLESPFFVQAPLPSAIRPSSLTLELSYDTDKRDQNTTDPGQRFLVDIEYLDFLEN